MKKLLLLLLCVVLVVSVMAIPANASQTSSGTATITVTANAHDSGANPGAGQIVYTFSISSTAGLTGVQFKVKLPDGITENTYAISSDANTEFPGVDSKTPPSYDSTKGFIAAVLAGTNKSPITLMTLTCDVSKSATVGQALTLDITDVLVTGGDTYTIPSPVIDKAGASVTISHGDQKSDFHDWQQGTVTDATCTTPKTTEYTCSNSSCGAKKTETAGSALGHKLSATFDWGQTNGTTLGTVTATVTCANGCADYTDKQITVPADSIKRNIVSGASCTEPGKVTYTATIVEAGQELKGTSSEFAVSQLGHQWGEPTYKWGANGEVTATRECTRAHDATDTATATGTKTEVAATCETDGSRYYTADVKFTDGTEFKGVKSETETLPATGHNWTSAEWTWSEDHKTATAVVTCDNDNCPLKDKKSEALTAEVSSEETKAVTCTEDGTITYTATVTATNKDGLTYKSQDFTDKYIETVPAIGHKYAAPTVEFTGNDKDGYTSATATWVCENDGEHTITRTDEALDTEEVAATYAAAGSVTYTAEFKVEASEVTAPSTIEKAEVSETKEVETPMLKAEVTATADESVKADKLASDVQDLVDAALTAEGEAPGIDENLKAALKEAAKLTDEGLTVITELKVDDTVQVPSDVTGGLDAIEAEITVTVKDGKGTEVGTGKITEVKDPIELKIAKPNNGGPIFYVVTDHTPNTWTEVSSKVVGDDIVFSTTQFSTFVVVGTNDLAHAEIEKIGDQTYTGKEIKPAVKVTINGGSETLEEGVDYEVVYEKNTDVGTASVTIKAKGTKFTGTKTINFNIVKAPAPAGTNASTATKAPSAPGTGDETPVVLYAAVLTACAAALGVVLFLVRRRQQQK